VSFEEVGEATARHNYSTISKIQEAYSGGRYEEARLLIDEAFEIELDFALNDAGRRPKLLFFSAAVSTRFARWKNALRDMDEAIRLNAMITSSSLAPMKLIREASREGLVLARKSQPKPRPDYMYCNIANQGN
jgi:hypothetical protein